MKKFCILVFSIILTSILIFANAETTDLSALSFDELSSLKTSVDLEYYSRSESEGILLNKGVYIIGKDLKPGQYYVGMIKPDPDYYSTWIRIYEDYETYAKDEQQYACREKNDLRSDLGRDPKSIILNENEVIFISQASAFFKASVFEAGDYYVYEPPKGTMVPISDYIVGDDIPVGIYNVYPGSVSGGDFQVFIDKETPRDEFRYSERLSVLSEIECDTVDLKEGEIVKVFNSIIMAKKQKLQFD